MGLIRQPGRRATQITGSAVITIWSAWLSVVHRTTAVPQPGRERDGLVSSTSRSSRRVSPGRVGRGQRRFRTSMPMTPSAKLSGDSTAIRIDNAAVCHPLADRPPKKLELAVCGSVWKYCGSNCRPNSTTSRCVTGSGPPVKTSPGVRSSKYSGNGSTLRQRQDSRQDRRVSLAIGGQVKRTFAPLGIS